MDRNKLFISLLLWGGSIGSVVAQETIRVAALPGDATPRLQSAIEQARQQKGRKVVIQLEPGDYHLYRTSASTQVYYISNTASKEENPDLYPGEVFQMRDAIRDEACGFIHRSKNVTLEQLNLHFLGNFGIVGQYSENLTYNRLNCEPEHGSGRTCAGFADFVQMSGCKGKLSITNSRFEGAQDDPINVHGTHLKVVNDAEGKGHEIVVRFMHPQSYGFDAFFVGDEVELTDVHSLKCLHKATIRKAERLSDYDVRLTLNRFVPHSVQQREMVIENTTWTPEVEIRNNYFARTPTRGILVTTRKKSQSSKTSSSASP